MLSRLKMSQKLIGGFTLVVIMLTAAIVMQIQTMGELGRLQDEGAKRTQDVIQLGHVMETLDASYGVIADAIINRRLDRSKSEFTALEARVAKDEASLLALVDTPEEKAWANEFLSNFKGYLAIFKSEVMPLLAAKAGDEVLDAATIKAVQAMDERMDTNRSAADDYLQKIIASLQQEDEEGDKLFDATRKRSITLATIISILAAAAAMAIAYFLTRSITRPINDSINSLDSASSQISATARQVSTSSQSLADGASEQASSLEETSASMEELNAMTKQNADNATQADAMMRQSLSIISETNDAMDAMDRSMSDISTASEQTYKIIKTIDEIAFQTNLLALNAAVEAARAGEAGAGFAVVADEVRNLAMRATEAAKNTSQLIEGTVSKVNAGKEIVSTVTVAFKEVAESSAKVGSLLSEITTASKEQAMGLGQINQAITQMDSVTQQNASTSEESAAAAEELNSQAASMIDIVISLRSLIEGQNDTVTRQGQSHPAASSAPPTAKAQPSKTLAKQGATARPALALPARPASTPSARPATKKVDPESIIPMGDDGSFEDF